MRWSDDYWLGTKHFDVLVFQGPYVCCYPSLVLSLNALSTLHDVFEAKYFKDEDSAPAPVPEL